VILPSLETPTDVRRRDPDVKKFRETEIFELKILVCNGIIDFPHPGGPVNIVPVYSFSSSYKS